MATDQQQNRSVPVPVLLARRALNLLREEGVEITPGLEKALPGYALHMAKLTGGEITVDLLCEAARGGEDNLKAGSRQKIVKNSEDVLSAYRRIIKGFDAYEGLTPQEQLFVACERGDMQRFESIIAQGVDVNELKETNEGGYSPITIAALNGHVDVVSALIKHGASMTANKGEIYPSIIGVAAMNGHTDVVPILIEHGADITADYNAAIFSAAEKGHTDMVRVLMMHGAADASAVGAVAIKKAVEHGHAATARFLIEHSADLPVFDHWYMINAARLGYAEIVQLLIEQGVDITANNNNAVRTAVYSGHVDIARLLIEKGADIKVCNGFRISSGDKRLVDVIRLLIEHGFDLKSPENEILAYDAAKCGQIEILRLLIEQGVNIKASESISIAVLNNETDVVRLLIENGADIRFKDNTPVKIAFRGGYTDTGFLLFEHGADISHLSEETRNVFHDHMKNVLLWRKIVHTSPPQGLHTESPQYFKRSCFDSVVQILEAENYTGEIAHCMAFHATALFQSESRVLQYLEQWGSNQKQPLHDLIHMIAVPATGNPNLKDWGDAVLKCGPSMARLVKFGNKLTSPLRSSDGRTWSMINTRVECAAINFSKASEHPALAALCFEHNVDEESFNSVLQFVQSTQVSDKNIPNLEIDGGVFNAAGSRFYLLPAGDVRGLFLGEMTDCCQSFGGFGHQCAKHGYASPDSGFYVVENAKGRIVGQTWAWRGKKGEMCFDSLETLGGNVTAPQWNRILQESARQLSARKDHDVTALHVGKGGDTPKALGVIFKDAKLAKPKDYDKYRDSANGQLLVWERSLSL